MRLDSSGFFDQDLLVSNRISATRADSSRWRGAIAGLVPALAIASLFAFGGTTAAPSDVAVSLFLVALIAMTAGWIAGPLAAYPPRRLLVAAIGYAIAFIGATAGLSVIQAAWDSLVADGPDPVALATAIIGRFVVALAGTAYLIIPAVLLGLAWSVVARGLMTLMISRTRAWR